MQKRINLPRVPVQNFPNFFAVDPTTTVKNTRRDIRETAEQVQRQWESVSAAALNE